MSTETDLRDQIKRYDWLASRNPVTERDFITRKEAAQRELNNLLLSQEGYEVVKTSDIDARIEAAIKASYADGHAAAKAEMEAAVHAAEPPAGNAA